MSITSRESAFRETAVYGGMADAIGGLATIVIAIVGLSGVNAANMAAIGTIVFGAALLILGGAMASEYARILFPAGSTPSQVEGLGGSSLTVVFLVGIAGIVLGLLALLGIQPTVLTPIAAIAFGSALVLSAMRSGSFMRSNRRRLKAKAGPILQLVKFSRAIWPLARPAFRRSPAWPSSCSPFWRWSGSRAV